MSPTAMTSLLDLLPPRLFTGLAAGLLVLSLGLSLGSCADEAKESRPAGEPATKSDSRAEEDNTFKVKFTTTVGNFTVEVHPNWSPLGAARFKEMVTSGFYKDIGFFRVLPDFMVQFGIHGDPKVSPIWKAKQIADDPKGKASNTRGMISFATSGANSRTTQIFINYKDNSKLDPQGFTPFAMVIEGMNVVSSIANVGQRADQGMIHEQGNAYLKKNFPQMDYVNSAVIVE